MTGSRQAGMKPPLGHFDPHFGNLDRAGFAKGVSGRA